MNALVRRIFAMALLGVTTFSHAAPWDPPPPSGPADGAAIYRRICEGCHMSDGKGAEGAGRYPALAGNPRLSASPYAVRTVLLGRRGMPPFRQYLDDAQVAAVVNHVRTTFGNDFRDPVTVEDVKNMRPEAFALGAALVAAATTTTAADLVRHRTPGSDFPILMAVEVPSSHKTIYLSGAVPGIADSSKPAGTLDAYGDTRTQTVSVLQNIERNLKRLNLAMSDVIKMQVFLVGDPRLQGKMDFKGMMDGYTQIFGTKEQPNLPTRSVFQVSGLANPGWLVEIEVVAAVRDSP
jgi:enamine deaminase RidA (YjgF/YER057c/UK114 family)/mono/diheme cytochrome c family protein